MSQMDLCHSDTTASQAWKHEFALNTVSGVPSCCPTDETLQTPSYDLC